MFGLSETMSHVVEILLFLIFFTIVATAAGWITNRYLILFLETMFKKTRNKFDDALLNRKLVHRAGYIVPILIIYLSADLFSASIPSLAEFIKRLALTLFVMSGVGILDSLLKIINDIYSKSKSYSGKAIKGYTDALLITSYILAAIFIVSIITNKSPWGIFSILGGFTVILMLVFKDSILGFVASIQLTSHDMVRIGDWIEMPKYGADGDVIDISIHTVKVRNWDKTISTIPTYDLVSGSIKNWRGMTESGGRRIKRSISIDMNSIKFCDNTMLENFSKFQLITDYINRKKNEIAAFNKENNVDETLLINGRRQTNLGVFRAYIIAFLKNNPLIHKEMTFLVKHLQPTAEGLPIEIYVFSKDQVWANYEAIQADIFDHLLAAVPLFELRLFQKPTGHDFIAWKDNE